MTWSPRRGPFGIAVGRFRAPYWPASQKRLSDPLDHVVPLTVYRKFDRGDLKAFLPRPMTHIMA